MDGADLYLKNYYHNNYSVDVLLGNNHFCKPLFSESGRIHFMNFKIMIHEFLRILIVDEFLATLLIHLYRVSRLN